MVKQCLLIGFLISYVVAGAQDMDAAKQAARQYVQLFAANNFEQLVAAGDSTMQRKADKETLEGLWESLVLSHGNYQHLIETRVSVYQENYITVTVVKFEKRKVGFQLTLNKQLQIAGVFLVAAEEKHQVADYVKTENFYELKIPIAHKKYPTQGVLSLPKTSTKVPLVILVHGSGAIDKDCSIGPNKIYKDLAWGMAAKGIAVFRYDKRTYLHLKQLLADNQSGEKAFDVRNEYVEDVKAIIELLSKRKEVDKSQIYLMGHSEGGYLIPLFNQRFKSLAGFVALAGTLRQIPELALEQMDYLTPDSLTEKDQAQLLMMKQSARNALAENIKPTMPDSLVMQPFPTNYWVYLKTYQPQQLALQITKPLLVLQGERDYQVKMKDFGLWKSTLSGKPNVSFSSYPQLNHLFLAGTGASTPDEYLVAANVPEYVINDVVKWITANKTAQALRK